MEEVWLAIVRELTFAALFAISFAYLTDARVRDSEREARILGQRVARLEGQVDAFITTVSNVLQLMMILLGRRPQV